MADGAERRLLSDSPFTAKTKSLWTRYIANLTPLCAVAIIATCARVRAPTFRDFLQRYICHRVFFGVSMVCIRCCPGILRISTHPTAVGLWLRFRIPHSILRAPPQLVEAE